MVEHVHVDPVGGVAGDMFVAAMLDAFPGLADSTLAACRGLGLPPGWSVDVEPTTSLGLAARRFVVGREHARPEHAAPVSYALLRERIAAAPLEDAARDLAQRTLRRMAEAESRVHDVPVEQVHFHELGDWDSLVDVVAAAHLAVACGARSWSCGPLPLGGGRVRTDHGWLPVPAPATALLMRGLDVVDDGVGGERVTPTGAAIVRELVDRGSSRGSGPLLAIGHGAGTRELPGIPNVTRVLAFGAAEGQPYDADVVLVVEFEVDDQSPEDLALGLDHLRAARGVLDVATFPGTGKKGRTTLAVRVLARPGEREGILRACFEETRTLGLRWRLDRRALLPRREVPAGPGADTGRVKLARRGAGTTAKADADAVASMRGFAARDAARRGHEEAALRDLRKRSEDEDEGGG